MTDRFANRWDNLDTFGLETPFAGEALLEAEAEWHLPAEAESTEADEALDWLSLEEEGSTAGQVAWEDKFDNGEQATARVRNSASGGLLWTIRDRDSKARITLFVPPAANGLRQVDVLVYAHGLLGNAGPPQRGGEGLVESKVFQLAATVVASGRPVVLVVPLLQTAGNKSWSARGFDRPSGLNRLVAAALAEVGAKTGGAMPNLGGLFVAGHSRGYGILYPLIRTLAKSTSPASLVPGLSGIWMLDASYPKYGRGFPDAEITQLASALPSLKIRIAYLKRTPTDPLVAGFSAAGADLLSLIAGKGLQHGNVPAHALSIFLSNGTIGHSAVQTGQEAMAYHNRISGDFEDQMAGMDETLAWQADEGGVAELEEEYFTEYESEHGFAAPDEAELLTDQYEFEGECECEDEQIEGEDSFELEDEWEYDREDEEPEFETEPNALSLLFGQGEDVAMGAFDWLLGTSTFLLGPALKRGSEGPGVAFLQRLMQRLGQTVSMDMKFGPGTQRAVQSLQRRLGLAPTGEADAPTKAAFVKALGQLAVAQPAQAPSTTGGARLTETPGGIRKLPISDRLRELLIGAANDAGVDQVNVFSGGQIAKGAPGAIDKGPGVKNANRTGSTRHDSGMAADLKLKKNGRILDWTNLTDRPTFETFVTSAVRRGATGIGAGRGYMGTEALHVGFGKRATWGGIKKDSPPTPPWLKAAFDKGLPSPAKPTAKPAVTTEATPVARITALPMPKKDAERAATWLMQNFGKQMRAAVQGKTYKVEHLCAIACKETAYKWLKWISRFPPQTIVERAVFDASGDAPDTNRNAFPNNGAQFRKKYGDTFADMLIEEGNKTRRMQNWTDRPWVYKGYGLFQYDLQHVEMDRDFFENRHWYSFDACLKKCTGELDTKLRATNGDLWEAIRKYNGSGTKAQQYREDVRALTAVCALIVAQFP